MLHFGTRYGKAELVATAPLRAVCLEALTHRFRVGRISQGTPSFDYHSCGFLELVIRPVEGFSPAPIRNFEGFFRTINPGALFTQTSQFNSTTPSPP
jgi:hypothetical protein